MTRPKKPAPLHERAARSMRAHPWITWGSAASAVTVIAAIITGVLWVDARYQTASAADAHVRDHRQERAEVLYQISRQEVLILRNRAMDCRSRAPRNQQEAAACDMYRNELREAERRSTILFQETQKR